MQANMPMRRYLEQEFQTHRLRFPTELVETTSAFATLSPLQRNPAFVALLSTEVAQVFSRTGDDEHLIGRSPCQQRTILSCASAGSKSVASGPLTQRTVRYNVAPAPAR